MDLLLEEFHRDEVAPRSKSSCSSEELLPWTTEEAEFDLFGPGPASTAPASSSTPVENPVTPTSHCEGFACRKSDWSEREPVCCASASSGECSDCGKYSWAETEPGRRVSERKESLTRARTRQRPRRQEQEEEEERRRKVPRHGRRRERARV